MSRYFVLDGPDGCGKSSQARALCDWLREQGRTVLHVREPGSTPVGEALRQLLLSPTTGELQPISEVLLFSAARAELVAKVIAPALAAGQVVIAERCYLSTVVYQVLAHADGVLAHAVGGPAHAVGPIAGGGTSLEPEWLLDLTRRVHGAVLPDAIFVLDVPSIVAMARRTARTDDRIEARGPDYHERVRRGFLQASAAEVRAVVVDAAWPFASVQAQLRAHVARRLS